MRTRKRRSVPVAVYAAVLAVLVAVVPAALAANHQAGGGPVFTAVADTYVTSASPRRNFGRSTKIEVDRRPLIRTYMRFRLSGLPRTVRSVKLRVYVSRSRGGRYGVAAVRRPWTERALTFASAPRLGRVLRTVIARTPGWSEVDITPLARRNGVVNLALTGPNGVVSFASRETGARAPRLIVDSISAADPVIAAAGNIACDPIDPNFNNGAGTATACRQRATSDLLVGRNFAAVLALGDNQYECGSEAAYRQAYDPTWGRVKAITRPVPGNHELGSTLPGTECDPARQPGGYFRYFGAAAGESGRGYYSFDVGRWHLIALNTNCENVGGCGRGSAQLAWLENDLRTHPNFCTLAYFHHPRFSSSYTANRDVSELLPFWQVLHEAGVDVVLSAHDHIYERFAPQDPNARRDPRAIRQFVVGTGGRDHHPLFAIQPNSEVRSNDTFGVLSLTLHPASYNWEFIPEAGRTFRDSGSTVCH